MVPEKFVDSVTAAEFLGVSPRYLLDLTRAGRVPGHPLGLGDRRHVWRYRLTELEGALAAPATSSTAPSERRTNRSL
jgi:hypothetical protein